MVKKAEAYNRMQGAITYFIHNLNMTVAPKIRQISGVEWNTEDGVDISMSIIQRPTGLAFAIREIRGPLTRDVFYKNQIVFKGVNRNNTGDCGICGFIHGEKAEYGIAVPDAALENGIASPPAGAVITAVKKPSSVSPDVAKPPQHKNTMAIIVDVYDWAWDIASRELLRYLPGVHGDIFDMGDFFYRSADKVIGKYDIVLVYPWGASGLMKKLNPDNTIICMAGGDQLKIMDAFDGVSRDFKFIGACNPHIKRVLAKRYPEKTILLLSHGVDTKLFKPNPKTNTNAFAVGWVGRTTRQLKRFGLAQRVMDNLYGANFLVADFHSDGAHKNIGHRDMPQFYNSLDCLLVTSDTEAHPLVVYEAMACGIPVVATRVGDVANYIKDGKNGFVLPIDAPVSMFSEKIKMLYDKGVKTKMGWEARKTVLAELAWEKVAREQYKDLKKIVRGGG